MAGENERCGINDACMMQELDLAISVGRAAK